MTTPQRVDVARLSELLSVIASSNPDRRADYPGGCDCHECGCIFIGGDGHDYCAQCEAKRQLLAMLPEALPALLQQLAELERDNETMRGADYHQAGVEQEQEIIDLESKLADRDAEVARLGEELDVANTALGQSTTDCVEASFRAEAAERAREELQEALNETEGQLSALGESYAEIYLAMEEAHGLLRDVIAWHRTVPIDETPNRKDGGIFGRIAAFLAENGG